MKLESILSSRKVIILLIQITVLLGILQNTYSASIHTNEIKSGPVYSLCGDSFVMTWRYICKFKQHQNSVEKKRRSKRSIEDFLKPRTKDLIQKKGALSFLKSRNRRQVILGGTDNADEECCKESCSYGEIAEYDC